MKIVRKPDGNKIHFSRLNVGETYVLESDPVYMKIICSGQQNYVCLNTGQTGYTREVMVTPISGSFVEE